MYSDRHVPTTSTTNFCRDCAHYEAEIFPSKLAVCTSVGNIDTRSVDLVKGRRELRWKNIEYLRENEDLCGQKGKWFSSLKEFNLKYQVTSGIMAASRKKIDADDLGQLLERKNKTNMPDPSELANIYNDLYEGGSVTIEFPSLSAFNSFRVSLARFKAVNDATLREYDEDFKHNSLLTRREHSELSEGLVYTFSFGNKRTTNYTILFRNKGLNDVTDGGDGDN